MNRIEANLQEVNARIETACRNAGRRCEEVTLLAVSKTFPLQDVLDAVRAGQRHFGENYIQEAVEKINGMQVAFAGAGVVWHCIGPIQSNKTRQVAEHFDWVHTVDRLKIAQRLSEQRPTGLPDLQVCIQVNVDGGANKSGVAPTEALALARAVAALPRLRLRGVMSIPEPCDDPHQMRAVHLQARQVLELMRKEGLDVDTLSLGMSADLATAVEAGSTMVRVGTAIFGRRA
jgi:pyridoxal phosphate enzyme (YggS family)